VLARIPGDDFVYARRETYGQQPISKRIEFSPITLRARV